MRLSGPEASETVDAETELSIVNDVLGSTTGGASESAQAAVARMRSPLSSFTPSVPLQVGGVPNEY